MLNRRSAHKWIEEKLHLQPLPVHRLADYEVISVRVTSHSTITVRCMLYTVPAQLIGQRLTVHLYQDRLLGFLGNQQVVELTRIYAPADSNKRRARSVNYRHVIDSQETQTQSLPSVSVARGFAAERTLSTHLAAASCTV